MRYYNNNDENLSPSGRRWYPLQPGNVPKRPSKSQPEQQDTLDLYDLLKGFEAALAKN